MAEIFYDCRSLGVSHNTSIDIMPEPLAQEEVVYRCEICSETPDDFKDNVYLRNLARVWTRWLSEERRKVAESTVRRGWLMPVQTQALAAQILTARDLEINSKIMRMMGKGVSCFKIKDLEEVNGVIRKYFTE